MSIEKIEINNPSNASASLGTIYSQFRTYEGSWSGEMGDQPSLLFGLEWNNDLLTWDDLIVIPFTFSQNIARDGGITITLSGTAPSGCSASLTRRVFAHFVASDPHLNISLSCYSYSLYVEDDYLNATYFTLPTARSAGSTQNFTFNITHHLGLTANHTYYMVISADEDLPTNTTDFSYNSGTCSISSGGVETYYINYHENGHSSDVPGTQIKTYGVALLLSTHWPSTSDKSTKTTPVTYYWNGNGGSVSPSSNSGNITETTTYSFSSWNTNYSGSGTRYNPGDYYYVNASLTLYAIWNSSTSYSYDKCTAPTPTRSGFTPTGWYNSSGTKVCNCGETISITTTQTLYAGWSRNNYSVSLTKSTGISSVSGGGSKSYESSVTISATPQTGYSFKNWTNTNTGTIVTTSNPYTFTMPASNVYYTANATINSYTIMYKHYKGGVLTNTTSETLNYGTSITLSDKKLSYSGYTYSKATTDSGGSSVITTDTVTGAKTYYLWYTANSHTLTLNTSSGVSSVSGGGTKSYGQQVTISASVSSGYTWSHWQNDNTGTRVTTANPYTFTMPDSNLSYTAKATINSYTVTFYHYDWDSGAIRNPTTTTVTYGSTITLEDYKQLVTGYVYSHAKNKAGQIVTRVPVYDTATYYLYYKAKDASYAANEVVYDGKSHNCYSTLLNCVFSGDTTSATEGGTYSATATPQTGHTWSDGTETTKTFTWKIKLAQGHVTLNPTSLSLTYPRSTKGTVNVDSHNGDIYISHTSGDIVATTSYDNKIITFTASRLGHGYYTVTCSATRNYTLATADIGITVTGSYKTYISDGSGWKPARSYISNGSEWKEYYPYISNGSGWK